MSLLKLAWANLRFRWSELRDALAPQPDLCARMRRVWHAKERV